MAEDRKCALLHCEDVSGRAGGQLTGLHRKFVVIRLTICC